ncbi:MAG: TerB family tellurite resistance protein [Tahibacter sp.]
MNAFLPASVELPHLQAIVRAMHELAVTDGVHDTERVMLRGFYESCQQDAAALTSFDDLIATPFDLASVAASFDTPERKGALLQSCLLLAHADGSYSAGERAKVQQFARQLGVSSEELHNLEESVADYLVQQISRISNIDALQEVAAKMAKK